MVGTDYNCPICKKQLQYKKGASHYVCVICKQCYNMIDIHRHWIPNGYSEKIKPCYGWDGTYK